jgi:hypothetical protein
LETLLPRLDSRGMLIKYPEPRIFCDKCGCRDTASEDTGKREGWVIDYGVEPHKHFCPDCREKMLRQGSAPASVAQAAETTIEDAS